MAADGSIVIKAKFDSAQAEKELDRLTKKIESAEKKLFDKKEQQSSIKTELEDAKNEAKKTETAVADLKAQISEMESIRDNFGIEHPVGLSEAQASLKEQESILTAQNREVERLDAKYTKITDSVMKSTDSLNSMKAQATEISEQIEAASRNQSAFGDAVNATNKKFDSLLSRVSRLVSRVFVFSMITAGLRALRDWMGNVIQSNDEASDTIARLKGAFLTMMQPLVSVVIPVFTTIVNLLTAIIGKIATFLSMLGGKTVQHSADAAKALNKQANAIGGVGSAAEEAQKQLMGFDEINKLSGETSSAGGGGGGAGATDIQPDFNWADGISETLDRIADLVLLIGAGFALWKISDLLPGKLGDILGKLGLILAAIGFLLIACDGIKNAWENGVNWGNMAEMILGVAGAAVALYLAFGGIAAGITLVVGGIALLIVAFHDMMENGMNLQNTLLAIAAIMMAGIGIGIMTKSWIPLLIAGIASLLLAIVYFTGHGGELISGLKQLCQGFIDFFTGVFSGDWDKAWQGIVNVGKGAVNVLISIINSMIDLIVRGLNLISFDVPSWIPGIGGRHVGFNIQNAPQIPYLAQGAVIPPNREFLAVLGDQRHGTNIEAPLSTIEEAVAKVTASAEQIALLREQNRLLQAILESSGVYLDGRKISETVTKYQRQQKRSLGV